MNKLVYKIVVLGDSSVGKTCFNVRYYEGLFKDVYIATVGLDCKTKKLQLEDGKEIKLLLWDTAGQERFRYLQKNCY